MGSRDMATRSSVCVGSSTSTAGCEACGKGVSDCSRAVMPFGRVVTGPGWEFLGGPQSP